MKTFFMKIGSLFLLLFLIAACGSKSDQKKLEEPNKKPHDSINKNTRSNIGNRAFDISNASYTKDGAYSMKVNIPYSTINNVYLEPKIVDHIDISTPSKKIILLLAQHGKRYRGSLRVTGIRTKLIDEKGYIQNTITNFDPNPSDRSRENVYAIVLHDEDYNNPARTTQEKDDIIECLQNTVADNFRIPIDCESLIFKDKDSIFIRPRTIGNGGVIPPR